MDRSFAPTVSTRVRQPSAPSFWNGRTFWLLLLLLAMGWSLARAGVLQQDLINEGGWTLVLRFISAAVQPALNSDFLRLTAGATLVTLAYAVTGTALSLLIGGIGGVFASEVWWQAVVGQRNGRLYRLPWGAVRALLAFPRGLHELLWGLLFVNIFGLDPLTAILAIAIPYGAIIAKVFAETLDETPRRPFMTLLNSGVSPLKAFLYTLLPQAFPDLLSYSFYRFECAIRAAAVLGIIGAGGLGYQILLSFQTLRYEEMWTLFYALFLLSGLADFWSALLRRRLGRTGSGEIEGLASTGRTAPRRDLVVRVSWGMVAFLTPFSFWYIQADFTKLWSPRTAALLNDIIQASLPLRFEWPYLLELFQLSRQTLAMSILATLFAALGGILLAFPAANNFLLPGGVMDPGRGSRARWWAAVVLVLVRGFLLVARAIPAPVWALILLFVFFPGILPGALALGLYNLGVLGRLMAEVVENQNERPLRALKAQGASGFQVFLYGVLPATVPRFMAYSLYRWEIAIRATVIVGLVGAGGLGRLLTEQLSRFDYRSLAVTLICYIALTFLVDLISAAVRRTIR